MKYRWFLSKNICKKPIKKAYKKAHNRKNEETFFMWILYFKPLFSVAFSATKITFYGKSIVEFVCVHMFISAPFYSSSIIFTICLRGKCVFTKWSLHIIILASQSDLHIDRIVNKNALCVYIKDPVWCAWVRLR